MTTPPPAPAEAQEAVEARLERIRVRWSQAGLTSFSQDHADVAWLLSLVRPPSRPAGEREATPMTLDLEALKAVAEAATPGPWIARKEGRVGPEDDAASVINQERQQDIAWLVNTMAGNEHANAQHIATFDPPTVLALLARLEAAEKANRTRTDYDLRCQECGRAHILDTSLPSEIWNQIAKPEDLLCTTCIDDRLAVKGLTAEAEFYFVGNALVSKLYRDQTEARAEGFREGIEAAARWHLEQAAKIRRERARAKARLTDAEATDLECWAHRHELHAESIRALAAQDAGKTRERIAAVSQELDAPTRPGFEIADGKPL